MRSTSLLFLICCIVSIPVFAQNSSDFKYAVSAKNPYGKYNPKAPKQLLDYQELIGISDCVSESRGQNQKWSDPVKMTWKWKYIMNGKAIQDETLKEDGTHSGSIRQFNKDSLHWNVHYYTSRVSPSKLPVWTGNRKGNKIVLYKDQNAPNGAKGFFRLTFSEISNKGFNWIGEWVDKTEKVVFPTWRIKCVKRKD